MTRGHGATGAHFGTELEEEEQPQFGSGFPHVLQAGFLHPHIGFGTPHLLQGRASEKPSCPEPPTRTRRPSEPTRYMKPVAPREATISATIPINAI